MGPTVEVEGEATAEMCLELDEKEGKWRRVVRWRLPHSAPIAPASLVRVDGLASLPKSNPEMAAALRHRPRLTFVLDQPLTPAPQDQAPPAQAPQAQAPPAQEPQAPVQAPLVPAAVAGPASSSSGAVAGPGKAEGQKLVLRAQGDDGDPPGVQLDESLRVTKLESGGLLEGKVQMGDVVLRLNGQAVRSKADWLGRWNRCVSDVAVEVLRTEGAAEAVRAAQLPEHLEKLIIRKPGYLYLVEGLEGGGSRPLGLALETLVNRVVVVGVREGSVGAEKLKRWDVVLAVDGIRVSEASVAKALIRDRAGKFQALVERGPAEAAAGMDKALAAKRNQNVANESDDWASFGGPADVAEIAAAAIAQRRQTPPKPSIRRLPGPGPGPARPVAFSPQPPLVSHIVSDIHPSKRLRPVPRLS